MERKERQKATENAVNQIDEYLNQDYDYHAALMFSATYVHGRLRSILADRLSPEKTRWKDVYSQLGSMSFKACVSMCESLELIPPEMSKGLKELWDLRSKVAHESTLWVEPTMYEPVSEIQRLCKTAIDFLEYTSR